MTLDVQATIDSLQEAFRLQREFEAIADLSLDEALYLTTDKDISDDCSQA